MTFKPKRRDETIYDYRKRRFQERIDQKLDVIEARRRRESDDGPDSLLDVAERRYSGRAWR